MIYEAQGRRWLGNKAIPGDVIQMLGDGLSNALIKGPGHGAYLLCQAASEHTLSTISER